MPGSAEARSAGDDAPLGVTAAALLGLLALRPWTTYELAKQAHRSLEWFWPRAERKLYDEPKRLVARGYATAEVQRTGRRRRTVYRITPEGRRALRSWLGEPPESRTTFEIEQLVRVVFSDQATPKELTAAIRRAGDQSRAALAELGSIVATADPDDATFRDRDAVNAIGLRLVLDLHRSVVEWSDWATSVADGWDTTRRVPWAGARDVFDEAVAYAPDEERS